jgi:hypothetical protein
LTGDGTAIAKCRKAPDWVVAEIAAANKERVRADQLRKKKDARDMAMSIVVV